MFTERLAPFYTFIVLIFVVVVAFLALRSGAPERAFAPSALRPSSPVIPERPLRQAPSVALDAGDSSAELPSDIDVQEEADLSVDSWD